jgi:polyhydroxyalkanoate synthesis regulator phasin
MNITDKINKYLYEENGDTAYQKFFRTKLKEYGVKSPDELSKEQKKKFFDEVDKEWKAKSETD